MELDKILANNLIGNYCVLILKDNYRVSKRIEVNNLLCAINFVRSLTFEDCVKMDYNEETNAKSYVVKLFLLEDYGGIDCAKANGEYPIALETCCKILKGEKNTP